LRGFLLLFSLLAFAQAEGVHRTLDAAPYRGQSIRLRAAVPGRLYLQVVRPHGEAGFYDEADGRELVGEVAPDAIAIAIGLTGPGDVSLEAIPAMADAATHDAFRRVYAGIDAAYAASDAAALAQPGATVVIAGERTPLSSILEQVAAAMRQGAHYDSHSTVTAVRIEGDEATVWVTNRTAVNSQSVTSASRDTWERDGSGWRLKESVLVATHLEPSTGAVAAGLKQSAVPLPAGIAALGAAAGPARIVALGQASYGTREFADLNVRAIEELIQHRGFTVVAIEANWAEARAIDDYLRTGQGRPADAIAKLNAWPWEMEELQELVRWMRDWNAAPGPHATLRFAGIDVQPSPAADRLAVDYLKEYAPELAGPAELAYSDARGDAAEVAHQLDVNHRTLVAASSDQLWRDARQAAAVAWQARRGPEYRAAAMAANVEWLAAEAFPAAKIVVWSHNANVAAAPGGMGALLRTRYGSQLFTVGYAVGSGELRAAEKGELGVHALPSSPEGGGDAVLAMAGLSAFFLDLRALPVASPLAQWLAEPHLFHLAGAIWGDTLVPQAPAKLYDALVYVGESHPSALLP
jgi:erythromycin esterase